MIKNVCQSRELAPTCGHPLIEILFCSRDKLMCVTSHCVHALGDSWEWDMCKSATGIIMLAMGVWH